MALGDGRHKLPVRSELRQAIGKEAGDTVTIGRADLREFRPAALTGSDPHTPLALTPSLVHPVCRRCGSERVTRHPEIGHYGR
jgi:hypothetical protein